MLFEVEDSQLPALRAVDTTLLSCITGNANVELLRFRYRRGKRAVLHVASHDPSTGASDEGVIWFFAGNKARRLAREHPASHYHKATGALHEIFPRDHRLPELSAFVADAATLLPQLTGKELTALPRLLRYRPGVSATFRCQISDETSCYVKVIAKEDLAAIADSNAQIAQLLKATDVSIARTLGVHPARRIIVYEAASGAALDKLLATADPEAARQMISRVAQALAQLSSVSDVYPRRLGRDELLARAENACRLIALKDATAGGLAKARFERMRNRSDCHRMQLIHGDMKPEHAFLSDDRVTFIDTESLSLGDPNYDLAKLEARIVSAHVQGEIGRSIVDTTCTELREFVSPGYGWHLDAAILQTAKYFAQRPGQANTIHCLTMLRWTF